MTPLESRLRDIGLTSQLEARERLLILTPEGGSPPTGARRHDIVRLAREEGFTHVALEIDPDGAALSRD